MSNPCDCWSKTDEGLARHGMRIAAACTSLTVTAGDKGLSLRRSIPVERIDGKKLQASDGKGVLISFCPFCGSRISDTP